MELLRFVVAGNVDDGKSTLIGRLLYDSKSIFEDQLEEITRSSLRRGQTEINLALLTDGLKSERDQGITIDVAYRFFATPKRKFIIVDAPGHEQYTRNMVTGASHVNLAVILVDVTKGLTEQAKRHSFLSSLLYIRHLVVCINKMDLIDYDQEKFNEICKEFKTFASKLNLHDVTFIPISALKGENVVNRCTQMEWYYGPPLLRHLEDVYISSDLNLIDFRFPVQGIIYSKLNDRSDWRGYTGMVASGAIQVGDEVTILPSQTKSKVKTIRLHDKEIDKAFAPMSVVIQLEHELDVERGNMITRTNNRPLVEKKCEAMVCWFDKKELTESSQFILQHTTHKVQCSVEKIHYKIDINTLHRNTENFILKQNDIGRVVIRLSKDLYFDSFQKNKLTGCAILIDKATHATVGAVMII